MEYLPQAIEYPPPPKDRLDFIGGGASSVVKFLPPDRVLKFAHNDVPQDAEHERKIFEVLGSHPRIVRYFGMWKDKNRSVVLEYHPRGYLRQVLMELGQDRNNADDNEDENAIPRRKWAVQIVEGLIYIHSKGVVHGDLNASNILVGDSDDVVLCDFAGSSLNSEKPVALYSEPRHFRPREKGEEEMRIIKDDLFALGSVLYELYSHQKPYAEKPDHEVEKLYPKAYFPTFRAYRGTRDYKMLDRRVSGRKTSAR
jgi:serine/threonine protein kinase